MGQQSRARRAAKQRQRMRPDAHRARQDRSSTAPPGASGAPDLLALARQSIAVARLQHSRGVPLRECVRPLLAVADDVVDKTVELVLAEVLSALFGRGWTPLDLSEVGRRRLDADATAYLLDAVAAVSDDHPVQRVDPRWRSQIEQCDARAWWDRRRPQLSQWSARDGLSRHAALGMVVALLGVIERLPPLEVVLPAPGTQPRSGPVPAVDPAQEKVLAKVRALLAKAESTDFDQEAEALSAKAQQLMSRYALDRALVEHTHGVRQEATLCRIWLDAPYVTPKAMLVDAVAQANRCRAVLAGYLGYVSVVGADLDLRVVELLTTSLLLQGSRAMLATGSQASRSGVSRTRSYRQSFLVAYATRIGERLRAANAGSATAEEANRLLPVLSARSRAVEEVIEQQFPKLVSKAVSVSNYDGLDAGRAAADQARFDLHSELGAAV